jgi:hypothetical protein
MKLSTLHILFLLQLITISLFSQHKNKFNKQGERTGKWVIYIDEQKKIKSMEGKYSHGKSVGKSLYYSNNGTLERKEISRFKKIKTTFYYPNLNIKLKGNARIDNIDTLHYYFYGKWKSYNEQGGLEKISIYQKGKLIQTKYKDKSIKLNDSLIQDLNEIDKEFSIHNKQLTDSINLNTTNTNKVILLQSKLKLLDSISYSKIEFILGKFGYPSKEIVGEMSSIPFYIISFAPIRIRERYLSTFALAATNKDIELKSYAFYVDKIKVAKGEKQIYGTQYYINKNDELIYYPSEDPENLNKKRLQMELED